MPTALADKRCKPCEGGVEPLTHAASLELLASLDAAWILGPDDACISRLFEFPSYARTMAFVNVVSWVATVEGHHPELLVHYSSCRVRYKTTAIDGLSDNDFICAAKLDRLIADA